MDDEHVIEVVDLVTRFGNRTVHDGITLSVERGEVFAIVGVSGSGKTTLMREMALLQQPSAGQVRLFGQDVTGLPGTQLLPLRRRFGVLFQSGALFNDLTVAENVMVPLREHTRLSEELMLEVAAVKIALAGLEPESGSLYPSQLSGGMKKRVALARAMALDPELLFLDEPGSGLDPISAEALDELVLRLKGSLGLTIVMVTHDMESLWNVADRVALLGSGRLLGLDSVEALAAASDPSIGRFFHTRRGGTSSHGLTG